MASGISKANIAGDAANSLGVGGFVGDALNGFGVGQGDGTSGLIDMGAAPTLPGYNSIYDPNTMSLAHQMQGLLANDPTKYNTQPLQQIQSNAESTNASPWAQLQSQLAKTQTGQGMSQAANQAAGSTAQAQGNLAMSGGLSSGANERTQEAGQQGAIAAQQDVQNKGNQQQLQIGSQDAANKQQELMALPGMEAQAYSTSLQPIQMQGQADAQDMAAQMANNQALNQYNMGAFGNEASMYGAGQTANAQTTATEHSGGLFGGGGFLGLGGGSWLCTERGKEIPYTEDEKIALSQLVKFGRKYDREFTKWYLTDGKVLVTLVKASGDHWKDENNAFISRVLSILDKEGVIDAYRFYKDHLNLLVKKYWLPYVTEVAA